MTALVRRLLGSKSKMRVAALSNNAAAENETTKPSAINAGRALPVWPADAPSRIGSIGRVQGAATVTTPASRARKRLNISRTHRTLRAGHAAAREFDRFFGMPGRGVTLIASRIREPPAEGRSFTAEGLQIQSDPEGGIPSGS